MSVRCDPKRSGERDYPVVSIVIPAFNEESTIEQLVLRTRRVLEGLNLQYEVIVVDDGSNDGTALLCEVTDARIVRNGRRMGKGIALRRAFGLCRGDVIVTLDADGSHQPEEIPRLMAPILNDGFDFALGSRIFDLGSPLRARLGHLGNLVFSFLISLFSGERVFDSQCGFRAFKSHVVKELNISSRRFEIESEMLIKLLKKKYRFVEIPVKTKPSGSSSVSVFGDGLLILSRILSCAAS